VSLDFQAASDAQPIRDTIIVVPSSQARIKAENRSIKTDHQSIIKNERNEKTTTKSAAKATFTTQHKLMLHAPVEGLSVGFFERSLAHARPSSAPPVRPQE
jgi:hypothetical protein